MTELNPVSEPSVEDAGAERRAAVRRPSGRNASCHPPSATMGLTPVQVKDVSPHGAGLLVDRRFEPGTLLVLEVSTAADPVSVLARVVRLAKRPEGKWLVGCAFFSEIGEEELCAFLSERAETAGNAGRAGVRLPTVAMTVCRRASPGWLGQWPAEIKQRTAEGVGLLLPAEVEMGERLRVALPAAGKEAPRTALVRVTGKERQDDGRWLLDCVLC